MTSMEQLTGENVDGVAFYKLFEDFVFPQLSLSVWHQIVIYKLIRRYIDNSGGAFMITLTQLSKEIGASSFSARKYIRELEQKKIIQVVSRNIMGHEVQLLSPYLMPGVVIKSEDIGEADIEIIDFFDRKWLSVLIERQNGRCFYSLKNLDGKQVELDHVVCHADGGGNSFRNIVVCSPEMNKMKSSMNVDEFFRLLYRRGILNLEELDERLDTVRKLQEGALRPQI